MRELFVLLVALVLVGVPLALLCWAFGRTARHTADAGAPFLGGLGALLAVVGLIALVWTQWTFHDLRPTAEGAERWEVATGPLIVIGIGMLVNVAAHILATLQDRERR